MKVERILNKRWLNEGILIEATFIRNTFFKFPDDKFIVEVKICLEIPVIIV